jgi:hypothetical protein
VPDAALSLRERPTPEHRLTNLPDSRCTTGVDGRFLARGARLPRPLVIDVVAKGFKPLEAREVEVGARGVELVLSRAPEAPATGSLRVHVELEPDVSPLALLLRVRGADGRGRTPDWWSGAPMEVEGLAPGRYDVWLETRDGGLELARVEGVEVAAGKVAEDPRLLPFDARGLARTLVLRVVRKDLSPWRRRVLEIDTLEPRGDFDATTDDEGLATVVLPRRVTSLDVALEGQGRARVALHPTERQKAVMLD